MCSVAPRPLLSTRLPIWQDRLRACLPISRPAQSNICVQAMAASVLVDTSFLVAWLADRDRHHDWALAQARNFPPPWSTCEVALSEVFYVLGLDGSAAFAELLRRRGVVVAFDLATHLDAVLELMKKYCDVPMSLADACLVRMTEVLPDPFLLTTDSDFRVYRRHGRQVIPSVAPR
jgi:uncharacterized protein